MSGHGVMPDWGRYMKQTNVRFPGESAEYPAARDRLLEREVIRHFWGSELLYAPTEPGQDPRHLDAGNPLFNLLDLTPQGR